MAKPRRWRVIGSRFLARHLTHVISGHDPDEIAAMFRELEQMGGRREAFRRVATLAASGAPTAEVLSAVAEEAGRVAGAGEQARAYRYDPAGTLVPVVEREDEPGERPDPTAGSSASTRSVSSAVWRTGQVARVASGPAPVPAVVGIPILVNGRVWGIIVATNSRPDSLADDFESRMASFAEHAAAAIANTQARAALAASRLRVVAAADEVRRTVERNLHDGTQQRLVTLALQLRHAYETCPEPRIRAELSRMTEELASVLEELREISRGVHPAILSEAGLEPALRSLARRSALPVNLCVEVAGRLPEPLEVAAYYVVSEALTNAAKHSGAAVAQVDVAVREGALRVYVADDGVGGAREAKGSGIVGLRDRVEALGGTMTMASPGGGGTAIRVELPVTVP